MFLKHRVGTVRINNDKAVLQSDYGIEVELRGVQPFNHSRNTNYKLNTSELVENSEVNELYCRYLDQSEGYIQIQYISNIQSNYIFPDSVDEKVESINKVFIEDDEHEGVTVEHIENREGLSRSALSLNIGGIKLYVVSVKGNDINSGVIVYKTVQNSEVRERIRNCVSFCLGKRIRYHGYIVLNKDYKYVEVSYLSNRFKNLDDEYTALMPAPLGMFNFQLSSNETNRLANALYDNYEKYNLRHILWGYWYALEAPLHMAGVHFGACIEAFQSAYVSVHSECFSKKLIDKSKWKSFREQVLKVVDELNISEQELKVFENKIANLNQTPQSVITDRFFLELGIKLSDLENSAWKERNNAAHGKSSGEDFKTQIRNIKILKCLLHRMLLIATKGSDSYFDYYSYGSPVRALNDSIVEPIT
ncbi:hypothetical protein [Marinomonas foliarum]|uniref:ApeA N-terminal domain-containing protein n=1 Tax=Marinomonas foliarum TaxID=491950 RepID=A0ABX7IQC3_9GAMM|nr:hypothetical protein [Marinomonas foliarum]QRV23828.1 hypothetical protein JSY38_17725 [Marinomonas foliarum]